MLAGVSAGGARKMRRISANHYCRHGVEMTEMLETRSHHPVSLVLSISTPYLWVHKVIGLRQPPRGPSPEPRDFSKVRPGLQCLQCLPQVFLPPVESVVQVVPYGAPRECLGWL